MKKFDERDRLSVSAIKEFIYCKRRFALKFIDCARGENYKTVEGDILHKKVNNPFFNEKRGDRHISRSVPIFSERLNLYGVADIVEFLQDGGGVEIEGKRGLWRINPVEYKNGKPEKSGSDNFQLCTQALCLEEMFATMIDSGDVYYAQLRKRVTVPLTKELKQKTIRVIDEMNHLLQIAEIPPRPENQNCSLCSLKDICVPGIFENRSSNRIRIERLIKKDA